jgi:hypothetical protein
MQCVECETLCECGSESARPPPRAQTATGMADQQAEQQRLERLEALEAPGAVDFAALTAGLQREPGEVVLFQDWQSGGVASGSDQLEPGWAWVREAVGWSAPEGRHLLLRSAPGGAAVDSTPPNLLLRDCPAPEAGWARAAAAAIVPSGGSEPGEQAGLVWYRDDRNYLKLVVEVGAESGALDAAFVVVVGGAAVFEAKKDWPAAAGSVGAPPVTMRIELSPTGDSAAAVLDIGYCEQLVGVCEDVRALRLVDGGAKVGLTAHGASAAQALPTRCATVSAFCLLALAPDRVSFASPAPLAGGSGLAVHDGTIDMAALGASGGMAADFSGWTLSDELTEGDRADIAGMLAGLGPPSEGGAAPALYEIVEAPQDDTGDNK